MTFESFKTSTGEPEFAIQIVRDVAYDIYAGEKIGFRSIQNFCAITSRLIVDLMSRPELPVLGATVSFWQPSAQDACQSHHSSFH